MPLCGGEQPILHDNSGGPAAWKECDSASETPLNPAIPVIASIFPIPAPALAKRLEAINQFDGVKIFGLFVAQRPLDAQANGRTIGNWQWLIVQPIAENGL